jgi:hypothetical protein
MGEHAIRKLEIERYAVGELKHSRAAELEEHLRGCTLCGEYAARIKKEREAFLSEHPYAEISPETVASSYLQSRELWYERLFSGFAFPLLRPVLIPACLLLLVTMVAVPFMGRFTKEPAPPAKGFAYKGSSLSQLPYIYKRGNTIHESAPGDLLRAGDKVQVFYASAADQFVTLISIDSAGTVSFYQPDSRSAVCSIRSGVGTRLAYPLSISLDEAPGAELVIALLSPLPFGIEQIRQWAAGIYTKGNTMADLEKIVHNKPPAKSTVKTLLLAKQ